VWGGSARVCAASVQKVVQKKDQRFALGREGGAIHIQCEISKAPVFSFLKRLARAVTVFANRSEFQNPCDQWQIELTTVRRLADSPTPKTVVNDLTPRGVVVKTSRLNFRSPL